MIFRVLNGKHYNEKGEVMEIGETFESTTNYAKKFPSRFQKVEVAERPKKAPVKEVTESATVEETPEKPIPTKKKSSRRRAK